MRYLLEAMSKYPEYNKVTLDLIEILKKGGIIEQNWDIYYIYFWRKEITF